VDLILQVVFLLYMISF